VSPDGALTGEMLANRRHRARSLAGLFAAGASVSLVAILLPGWSEADRAGIAVTVGLAAGGAVLLMVWADRLAGWACHVFLVAGTVLIATCQVLAGSPGSTGYALLYVWIALHAALFFSYWTVFAHLVGSAVAQVVALDRAGVGADLLPQVALTLGTQVAAALVVGSLARRLQRLADTDSLTGVGNRRKLDERVRGHRASSRSFCIAVLDLDGFKQLNDRLGHAAGDRVLVEAAAAWRSQLRRQDTLARTGGDEFMVVFVDCTLADVEPVVRRLLEHTPAVVSCCAGLAQWDGRETAEQLVARADQGLYAAKSADGGGGVVTVVAAAADAPERLGAGA
jgi:diguanylate cyclase (GGDEF)-like protein